jgi:hypothetical protein
VITRYLKEKNRLIEEVDGVVKRLIRDRRSISKADPIA